MALGASGGGSRPFLSILLAPGHMGFLEEHPGPSAPLKGALEEKTEAWGASGRGGFVPSFLTLEPVFSHCYHYVFLSFKPRDLLFRGMLPRSLVDKVMCEVGTGLRGWTWGWERRLLERVGSESHRSHRSPSLAFQPPQMAPG